MMGFVSVPLCSGSVPLFTPPPPPTASTEGFSFIGFICSAGLYQLWCCLTVSDPDLAGFQSIIKELRVCAPPPSPHPPRFLQPWLMEKVTSHRGCVGSQQRQRKHQSKGTDKPQRQKRLHFFGDRHVSCIVIRFCGFFSPTTLLEEKKGGKWILYKRVN